MIDISVSTFSRGLMTEALFSQFLMVDRVAAAPKDHPARQSVKPRTTVIDNETDDQALHDALAEAFMRAVDQAPPGGIVLSDFAPLADAFADIATGRSVVLQLKPDLAEGQRSAIRTFLETVVRVSGTLEENRLEAAIGKLADVILPDELAAARGALATDNLELRDRFVAEVPQLTSAEIGTRAGLQTKNPYATAARWKKAGDIFSVLHRGTEYFPAFQFRDGRPHPTVKLVLQALPEHLSAWQRAFWLVSANGWLGDRTPIDLLDDPDAVIAAARHEAEEVIG